MEELSVLVCVTGQKSCHRLIQEGDRLAQDLNAQLCVLHVARPGDGLLGDAQKGEAEALEYLFEIAREHGAQMSVVRALDVIETIVQQAEKVNALVLVLGSARKGRVSSIDGLHARLPDVQFHIVYTEE